MSTHAECTMYIMRPEQVKTPFWASSLTAPTSLAAPWTWTPSSTDTVLACNAVEGDGRHLNTLRYPYLLSSNSVGGSWSAVVGANASGFGYRVSSDGRILVRVLQNITPGGLTGPLNDTTKFQDIGSANPFAMFTRPLQEYTGFTSQLYTRVRSKTWATDVLLQGVVASSVTIKVWTAGQAVLKDTRSKTMWSRPGNTDWLTFFTAPFFNDAQAHFSGLSIQPGDEIELFATPASGVGRIGRFMWGQAFPLTHSPNYGATLTVDDYSSVDADEFGNINEVRRARATRINVTAMTEIDKFNYVIQTVTDLSSEPVVLIGTRVAAYSTSMVQYGFMRDINFVHAGPTHGELSFEFKGYV